MPVFNKPTGCKVADPNERLEFGRKAPEWQRLKALVLDSVSSPITRRVYNMALDEFFTWFRQEPRAGFSKATVNSWRVSLEARGLSSSSISVRMSAVRKLAAEAADNGLLAPELATGIIRVKGVKSAGVRVGNWLSLRQAQDLLSAPDIATLRGLRDRAMLAVLLGCGLRRSRSRHSLSLISNSAMVAGALSTSLVSMVGSAPPRCQRGSRWPSMPGRLWRAGGGPRFPTGDPRWPDGA